LKDVHAVLNASLLYLTGVFGLRRGLIAIYKADEPQPHKFVSRGMDESAEIRWCQQLESYLPLHVMKEVCMTENDSDSPLAALLKGYEFCIWLPLKVDEQTWGGIARVHRLVRGGGGHWCRTPRISPQMARILSVSAVNR